MKTYTPIDYNTLMYYLHLQIEPMISSETPTHYPKGTKREQISFILNIQVNPNPRRSF